jgi:hypothetical protein
MTRPRLEIPWPDFSELEIQTLLKIHFESLGYTIRWCHNEDAQHERGIDLDCANNEGNRIVVAVKKDPKTEDIAQLLDLSRTEAKQRIYVRIKRGTQRFEDEARKLRETVDFWDPDTLENEMNRTGLTLTLLFRNSDVATEMLSICRLFVETGKEYELPAGNMRSHCDPRILKVLWDLKDRAVTLNKCFRLLQQLFEETPFLGTLAADDVRDLFSSSLAHLSLYGSRPILQTLERGDSDLLALIREVYLKTHTRSNWLHMARLTPLARPGSISIQPSGTPLEPGESIDPSESCLAFSQKMGDVAAGIEWTLDYMLEAAVGVLSEQK